MNYEGERFLLKLYRELYNEEEVKHSGTKSDDKFKLINKYMNRLSKSEKVFDGKHESLEKYMRERYYDRYVIKEEDIPESYFELQKRIALERGEGHINITPEERHKEAQRIIEDQKRSLDKWLDYLMKENTAYPMWARYWAFQGMLKLGMYDKEKNSFTRRSKGTTAPFIDLNPEALSYAIETVTLYQNSNNINDEELKKLVESGNFGKIYSHNLWKIANDSTKKDNTNSLEGEWVRYIKGDTKKVVKALDGKGTGWCIASEGPTDSYLSIGNLYIYFTKDKNGEYTVPRACIRTQGKYIAEVRGIKKHQMLEDEMTDIVESKLDEYPNKTKYKKAAKGMKKLTEIYNKVKSNIDLTKEELYFLFEIDEKIESFGWGDDPRIEEIKLNLVINDRALLLDLLEKGVYYLQYGNDDLKNDPDIILGLLKKEIDKHSEFDEIFTIFDRQVEKSLGKESILMYAGDRIKDNKEIVMEIVKHSSENLQFASERLRNDKEVILQALENDRFGSCFQYVGDYIKFDKEFILEVIKKIPDIFRYVDRSLKSDRDFMLKVIEEDPYLYEYDLSGLRNDKEIALKMVSKDGLLLKDVNVELCDDEEVVFEAVKNSGYALKYASERIRDSKNFVMEAIRWNANAFGHASKRLKNNRAVALEAVKINGEILAYLNEDFKNDREIVLEAVKQDGFALEYASDSLKNDREIVFEAVNNETDAFQYASENLKDDRDLVLDILNIKDISAETIRRNLGYNLSKDEEIISKIDELTDKAFDRIFTVFSHKY